MHPGKHVSPETISTESRFLLQLYPRLFALLAIISCLLSAGLSCVIFMNTDFWEGSIFATMATFAGVTGALYFAWQTGNYLAAPQRVLIDFDKKLLILNPEETDAREILFKDILYIRHTHTPYPFFPAYNLHIRPGSDALVLSLRNDKLANGLYFAMQKRGGIEMRQEGMASSVLPKNTIAGTQDYAESRLLTIRSVRNSPDYVLSIRLLLPIGLLLSMFWLISFWIVLVILLAAAILIYRNRSRLLQKHINKYWERRVTFDPEKRMLNEYESGRNNQIDFDHIDYIRFETYYWRWRGLSDYLFWIKLKNDIKERPLFAVAKDAHATEYYFFLQNELGLPMRQD